MNIRLIGLPERYRPGMDAFLPFHGIGESPDGLPVRISVREGGALRISRTEDGVTLELPDAGRVFRALTLLGRRWAEPRLEYAETPCFDSCGPMFDGSQASSLMNLNSCRKMMLILAGMGFNRMMLYCEDCYEIPGEPYWGNMRPRFSQADFRALDDFAYALGIELVPCMQTLGHLTEAIKRPPYARLADTSSVLMVDEEATYAFLEKAIVSLSSCFRSRHIHLGLDEAWDLGLGKYLKQNGYVPQAELMNRHVARVSRIAQRHGLMPMMWADMYFRARCKDGGYYDPDVHFTAEDRARGPENMQLIYWDYYHDTPEMYRAMISRYDELTDRERLVFAGCSRNVRTFGSHYAKTRAATQAGLSVCKEMGVRHVIATVWGDDHRESSTFAVLPGLQLFAEHMYLAQPEEAWVRERFAACACADWDAFMDINRLDAVPGFTGDNPESLSTSRAILWQDPLLGLLDADLGSFDFAPHYTALAGRLRGDAQRNPRYADMFLFYAELAGALAMKAPLGRALHAAYRAGDRAALAQLRDSLLDVKAQLERLRLAHRAHFFTEYKPIGWEVLDIRYGGAIMRLDTAKARLDAYLSGQLDRLEELCEERLSFSGNGRLRQYLNYQDICCASRL